MESTVTFRGAATGAKATDIRLSSRGVIDGKFRGTGLEVLSAFIEPRVLLAAVERALGA
jgi:hypothetical protein